MNTYSYFLTLVITVFLSLYQGLMADTISEEILEKIIRNETYCVKGYDYDHDRIYLNSDNIYPTSDGLFLNLNDSEHVQLPILQSDNTGCWIPTRRIKIFNDCPLCGEEYFITCKNPNCPSNKKGK